MMRFRYQLIVTLAMLVVANPMVAQNSNDAASTKFAFLALVFETSIPTPERIAAMAPQWERDGLSRAGNNAWRMADASGTFVLIAAPSEQTVFLNYMPSMRDAVSEAVLAALIARAERVEAGNPDTLSVTVSTKPLSRGSSVGTRVDKLTIELTTNTWAGTSVELSWPR